MSEKGKLSVWLLMAVLVVGALLLSAPAMASILGSTAQQVRPNQPAACTDLTDPKEIPSASMIHFDDLANATVIGDNYLLSHGVSFEVSRTNRALIYGNEPANAHSSPNVAINDAIFPNTSNNVPMVIKFDKPKTHVGMWIGNGVAAAQVEALLTVFNANNGIICQVRRIGVQDPHNMFIGIFDPEGTIVRAELTYGNTSLSESIDDLVYYPGRLEPTRVPLPAWTPVPTAKPTAGPAPTPTAVLPAIAYLPVGGLTYIPPLILPDLSIHGIEVTQGMQCFDTSLGLAACADNSLPMVAQKDSTARIYLRASALYSPVNNVPVRLYLIAAGVTYQVNTTGKATTSLNRGNSDSADVWFNVNFFNGTNVDFYAVVDPNNTIAESNEGNNRYPAAGYISLNFNKRRGTMKIIGWRLHHHPSGYAGTQNAAGWAVNGGAADWFEQLLPIRQNSINYVVKSGYLDWTKSLGSGDNQHSLIQTLNANWILENFLAFWFSGQLTGARHVYGWAPNDGYSGGHADMPVYPHAGGLGVVGIGTDRPGTNTDNPGGGALIFGHELVHDYDVLHTNTADACGSNDGNSTFPYASSSIQEFGYNPVTGKIYAPSSTHDIMSYCPSGGSKEGWISPFLWNTMYNKFTPASLTPEKVDGPMQPGVFYQVNAVDSLVVNATIFNPATNPPKAGQLGSLYHLPGGMVYNLPQGPYAVELRDAGDQILYTSPFTLTFESEYDAHAGELDGPEEAPPFPPEPTNQADVSLGLPWIDGTSKVVLTHNGQVIDEKIISPNSPTIEITDPVTPQAWAAGSTHKIAWTAADLDGDSLTYTLFYSHDAGANWLMLDNNLPGTEYAVETDSMAGGADVRFRVVANDGVNTSFDETNEAISIPNKAPQAIILNPSNGGIYLPGELVVLEGIGTDLEDGTLPDSALVWDDSVQGGIGIGPNLGINTLLPGKHTIKLTVTDSYGISGSASVTITVGFPIYLPVVNRQ